MQQKATDSMSLAELKEAYEAYTHGEDVGRLAARYGVYPVDLQKRLDSMIAERDKVREQPQGHTMGHLHEALFAELAQLQSVDLSDTDALKAEIERSKAIEGIAHTIIDGARTVLDAQRMQAQVAGEVRQMPKMLEG